MFDHTHHQKIHLILNSLNVGIIEEVGACFGGGTLITLLNNEYRWSRDVDFICPVGPGYRRLREIVADANFQPSIFFSDSTHLEFPRALKADQYGIRFLVVADQTPIKFEIVAEARISLNPPKYYVWPSIPCLDHEDQCTEKLLANADRWADTSIESRDLIDLAVLRHHGPLPKKAILKAESAYPVIPELKKALRKFLDNRQYRDKCFNALEIENRSHILSGVHLLANDFDLKIEDSE
ncbi:nucleotidyl transferase AbiEii/AbiGii toxin family protein [Marinimicrobium sp. ABcell2]|uniref:nucleotidyl transferase AbiEii/AbiGii toxin family protein n=1 Tax=Marinimicrobium sp. ABcell2 TaxID=3069751 RepID=UPI0027B85D01|nr:nucleotidyl transferase AbiEii/AbiGii toxin family protein [Marinimicrobium sp. ABcell2]MDQ2078481.1 nucleotidyl transferase AbiEii/AbiGii toxin family protein [Marinimicrobium sp. ABcell2]